MAAAAGMSAQMVGSAFVTQYYNVLHQWPQMVYRFYTDASNVIRADSGLNGAVNAGKGQADIHELIMSGAREGCRAEIKTVDSQDSFGGSVLVIVTGVLHRNIGKQKFVQSFFLAPQERGYFVLNDILRYLDEDSQPVETVFALANDSQSPAEDAHVVTSVAEHEPTDGVLTTAGAEEAAAAVSEVYEDRNISIAEEVCTEESPRFHGLNGIAVVERVGPIGDDLPFETLHVSEPNDKFISSKQVPLTDDLGSSFQELDAGKKSYASILGVQRDTHFASDTQPMVPMSSFHQPSALKPQPTTKSFESTSHLGGSTVHANEGDTKSIYVKNLSPNLTEYQLQEELSKFGAIRPDNILLRSNKDGGLYAFADFEESISARSAIEASPILIGGRRAYIEERKSTSSGGGGRGRGRGRGQDREAAQSNGARFSSYGSGTASSNGSRARPVYANGPSSKTH